MLTPAEIDERIKELAAERDAILNREAEAERAEKRAEAKRNMAERLKQYEARLEQIAAGHKKLRALITVLRDTSRTLGWPDPSKHPGSYSLRVLVEELAEDARDAGVDQAKLPPVPTMSMSELDEIRRLANELAARANPMPAAPMEAPRTERGRARAKAERAAHPHVSLPAALLPSI